MGLITPSQVTSGRFLSATGGLEALVADSYASSHKLKVGSTLNLNGTKFKVVGVVKAPLGGQSADVYIPLAQLQKLAGQKNQINVVLVRASKSSAVGQLQKAIEKALPSAQVASSQDVAKQISVSPFPSSPSQPPSCSRLCSRSPRSPSACVRSAPCGRSAGRGGS
jgi:hypothetical protein